MFEAILIEFFASFFIYFLFAGLIILWFIDGKIKKEQVIHALFACFLTFLLSELIKHFFPVLRPYLVNKRAVDVFMAPLNGSFPSEHTGIAFAVSITIFLHDKRIGWWFLVSALLIGIARVLANVHYPIDIVGGAFLGTLVAGVIDRIHFLKLAGKFKLSTKVTKS